MDITSEAVSPPRYSVLIVGFRSLRFLPGCLRSLLAMPGPTREILFLDNASPEPEADFVEANFADPSVRVFRSERNLYFAEGVNFLASRALGEFVALLNPDTEVDPNWISAMDACLRETGFEIANSDVREMSDPDRPRGEMFCLDPFGLIHFLPLPPRDAPIFIAGGAGMAIRRDVFAAVGGMDANFRMYFDEIDLCWRANLLGYRVGNAADAVVYHLGGGSSSAKPLFIWNRFRGRRNRIWAYLKNAGWPMLMVFIPTHLAIGVLSVAFHLLRGRGRYALAEAAALCAGFLGLRAPLSKRGGIQRTRLVKDRELFRRGFFVLRLDLHKRRSHLGLKTSVELAK
jgi:N-acetylglucosaminyl-diphospho-decaprenol L-rhamnosyltransferase